MNREGHNNENTKRDAMKRAFSRFNKLISSTCYNCRRLFFPGKHVTVDYTPPDETRGREGARANSIATKTRAKQKRGNRKRRSGEVEGRDGICLC